MTSSTARRRASKSSLSSVISTLHLHSFSKICKPFYMHVPAHSPSMKFRKILTTRCMPLVDEHYNPIRKECDGECVALNSTCRLVSNALFPSKTSFRRLCLLRSDLIYHGAIINSLILLLQTSNVTMPRFQVKILQVVLAAPGSALKVENADSVRAAGKTTSEAAPR